MKRHLLIIAATISLVWPGLSKSAGCIAKAAEYYAIPTKLLCSIKRVESGQGQENIISKRRFDGSYDIGWMQINTIWLPTLAKKNVQATSLLNGCVNEFVGAWIISNNIRRYGVQVGTAKYNPGDKNYLNKVLSAYRNLSNTDDNCGEK